MYCIIIENSKVRMKHGRSWRMSSEDLSTTCMLYFICDCVPSRIYLLVLQKRKKNCFALWHSNSTYFLKIWLHIQPYLARIVIHSRFFIYRVLHFYSSFVTWNIDFILKFVPETQSKKVIFSKKNTNKHIPYFILLRQWQSERTRYHLKIF